MVATGTKAELAKMMGTTQVKPAAWADSGLATVNPMLAEISDRASPNTTTKARADTAGTSPAWKRNPKRKPTAVIKRTTNELRTVSLKVRPRSTAERAIGSDRNRSTIPDDRSWARPTPVWTSPNTMAWTKMPGI